MINAIGDVAMQQTKRAIYNSVNHEQALVAQKNDQLREKRTVEKTADSSKNELNLPYEENTKTKNTFEDGQIIVEKYDEDGRLIRKIPPGYLPFGEIA
jgi:hypothetical protein